MTVPSQNQGGRSLPGQVKSKGLSKLEDLDHKQLLKAEWLPISQQGHFSAD